MFSIFSASTKQSQYKAGFGLIELLISISIIVLVAAIVMARQDAFNGAILLRNEAYDIALSLREAQLSAVSVQSNQGNFRDVIGVYFNSSTAVPGANSEYVVFRDGVLVTPNPSPNGFYDAGANQDVVVGSVRQLDPRFEIHEIRADGTPVATDELSIVFARPNFDARFFDAAASEVTAATIEIDIKRVGVTVDYADPGTVRTVEVTSAGQIAVQ